MQRSTCLITPNHIDDAWLGQRWNRKGNDSTAFQPGFNCSLSLISNAWLWYKRVMVYVLYDGMSWYSMFSGFWLIRWPINALHHIDANPILPWSSPAYWFAPLPTMTQYRGTVLKGQLLLHKKCGKISSLHKWKGKMWRQLQQLKSVFYWFKSTDVSLNIAQHGSLLQ